MIINYWKKIAFFALLTISAYSGHLLTDKSWQSDWDAHMLADAQANENAAKQALAKQQTLIKERDDATRKAAELQAIHDRAVADNRAANDRLRAEFDRLKAMYAADNPGTVISGAAAATDRIVLAKLLEQSHAAYGIVAEYADRNRQAVVNCVNEYNAVRTAINGK